MVKFPNGVDGDYFQFYLDAFKECGVKIHAVKNDYPPTSMGPKYNNVFIMYVTYKKSTGWILIWFDGCPGCYPFLYFNGAAKFECAGSGKCSRIICKNRVPYLCTQCKKANKFYEKNIKENIHIDILKEFVNSYMYKECHQCYEPIIDNLYCISNEDSSNKNSSNKNSSDESSSDEDSIDKCYNLCKVCFEKQDSMDNTYTVKIFANNNSSLVSAEDIINQIEDNAYIEDIDTSEWIKFVLDNDKNFSSIL